MGVSNALFGRMNAVQKSSLKARILKSALHNACVKSLDKSI